MSNGSQFPHAQLQDDSPTSSVGPSLIFPGQALSAGADTPDAVQARERSGRHAHETVGTLREPRDSTASCRQGVHRPRHRCAGDAAGLVPHPRAQARFDRRRRTGSDLAVPRSCSAARGRAGRVPHLPCCLPLRLFGRAVQKRTRGAGVECAARCVQLARAGQRRVHQRDRDLHGVRSVAHRRQPRAGARVVVPASRAEGAHRSSTARASPAHSSPARCATAASTGRSLSSTAIPRSPARSSRAFACTRPRRCRS